MRKKAISVIKKKKSQKRRRKARQMVKVNKKLKIFRIK